MSKLVDSLLGEGERSYQTASSMAKRMCRRAANDLLTEPIQTSVNEAIGDDAVRIANECAHLLPEDDSFDDFTADINGWLRAHFSKAVMRSN